MESTSSIQNIQGSFYLKEVIFPCGVKKMASDNPKWKKVTGRTSKVWKYFLKSVDDNSS